ncbi:MAG: hypothetical protein RIR52_2470 [Acidobacteriota bacterium]
MNKGAGESHPLLFTAGELTGTVIGTAVEPDSGKQLTCFDSGWRSCRSADQQRHHYVLKRREFGKQVMELEDETDALIPEAAQVRLSRVYEVKSIDLKASGSRTVKPSKGVKEGRLADTGGANHRDQFAPVDLQIEVLEDGDQPAASIVGSGQPTRSDDRTTTQCSSSAKFVSPMIVNCQLPGHHHGESCPEDLPAVESYPVASAIRSLLPRAPERLFGGWKGDRPTSAPVSPGRVP